MNTLNVKLQGEAQGELSTLPLKQLCWASWGPKDFLVGYHYRKRGQTSGLRATGV